MTDKLLLDFQMIDWDFSKEDSRTFLHGISWYPARFIPNIPAYLISSLSKENQTVLDPFVGSGTTLVEALKRRRNAIGIDINPISCYFSEVKCDLLMKGEKDKLLKVLKFHLHYINIMESFFLKNNYSTQIQIKDKLREKASEIYHNIDSINIPSSNISILKKWFHPKTLRMLKAIHETINLIDYKVAQNLCNILLLSILMPSSGHKTSRPYTYYADNLIPKNHIFKNSIAAYKLKLRSIINQLNSYTKENDISPKDTNTFFKIYNADTRNLVQILQDQKIDLIVTSPPYCSVTDYVMAYRLFFLWNEGFGDPDRIKREEIGPRWRRKNKDQIKNYVKDMKKINQQLIDILTPGGCLCLVFGGPKQREISCVDPIIEDLSEKNEITLLDKYQRNISKKFFIHPKGGGVDTEAIFIFQKR